MCLPLFQINRLNLVTSFILNIVISNLELKRWNQSVSNDFEIIIRWRFDTSNLALFCREQNEKRVS